jgi:hypothetical protein
LDCPVIGGPGIRVADRDRKKTRRTFFELMGRARVMMVGVAKESTEITASSASDIWLLAGGYCNPCSLRTAADENRIPITFNFPSTAKKAQITRARVVRS